jgi:hypothetical protein
MTSSGGTGDGAAQAADKGNATSTRANNTINILLLIRLPPQSSNACFLLIPLT